MSRMPLRQLLLISLMAGSLTVSSVLAQRAPASKPNQPAASSAQGTLTVEQAINGQWRTEADKARDATRHPTDSFAFWTIQPSMTVLEIRPGAGYWTDLLAPYLAAGGGKLIVTSGDPDKMNDAQKASLNRFLKRFTDNPALYGQIGVGPFANNTTKIPAAPGTVDLVISSRNFHGFVLQNMKDYSIKAMYDVLKPGGLVAIEQHRADARRRQDASTGYLRQDWIIAEMQKGGFEFVRASEMNANPKDTKDHPFGVWTLPPTLQTAPNGQPANPNFDSAPYLAIGESDRMTLLFRKPKL